MSKQAYYAIIGRIPDGENVTETFGPITIPDGKDEAVRKRLVKMFTDHLYDGDKQWQREVAKKNDGDVVFLEAFLKSDAPIEEGLV